MWSVGRFQDVDDLYGPINHHAFGHIDIQSVLCQHGIQIRHRIMILGSQLMVMRGGGKVLQGADDNPVFRRYEGTGVRGYEISTEK